MASASLRKTDLTVFVFVLAAMLSGMWLVDQFGLEWSPTFIVVTAVVAAMWTAYHRHRVAPYLGPDDDCATPDGTTDDGRHSDPTGDAGPRSDGGSG